jgi:hypothetical protein
MVGVGKKGATSGYGKESSEFEKAAQKLYEGTRQRAVRKVF